MEVNRTINIDVYGCSIIVVITGDILNTLRKYYKKFKKVDDLEGHYSGMFLSMNEHNLPYYVILNADDISVNSIAHESFHASCAILRDRGASVCGEDEEPQAYLLGYIIEEILKFVISLKLNLSNGASKRYKDK